MEITISTVEKEDSLQSMSKDNEIANDSNLTKSMVKKVKLKDVLVLNVKQSRSSESCIWGSFLQRICSLHSRVPKHVVSLDEKYLRYCLELIYVSAAEEASGNIRENLGSLEMGNSSEGLSSLNKRSRYAFDLSKFVIDCPLEAGTGNVVISPIGEWTVGRIARSKSIMNILKSPFFRQSGAVESDINYGRRNLIDATKSLGSNFMNSSRSTNISSSQKLQKKMVVLGNRRYKSEPLRKSLVSASSTSSTFSDQSSSLASSGTSQGMLHCTWEAGFPHYVFSFDDQKEAYVANLLKAKPPDDKVFDYMYTFHSSGGGKKDRVQTNESDLVGKMQVSTTLTLSPNNSEIKETEFVLFGADERSVGEMQTSSHILKKSKGLSKKMVEVFKPSHPSRQRNSSKSTGMSNFLENSSEKPCPDSCVNSSPLGTTNLSDKNLPPNLELAAIVVRDHIHRSHQQAEIGGWGLKFLKKVVTKQTIASTQIPSPSEDCLQNSSDCSTSIDILVPAGFHGGPRDRNGGPSSLTERWRSGGHCDCGGWDLGCPLTVLSTRPSNEEVLSRSDTQAECRSFDLFIQVHQFPCTVVLVYFIFVRIYFLHG